MSRYRKAILAAVVPVVGWVALKLGLELDPDFVAAVSAVIAGLIVARVPNVPESNLRADGHYR